MKLVRSRTDSYISVEIAIGYDLAAAEVSSPGGVRWILGGLLGGPRRSYDFLGPPRTS